MIHDFAKRAIRGQPNNDSETKANMLWCIILLPTYCYSRIKVSPSVNS
jgi:hypothetical protein